MSRSDHRPWGAAPTIQDLAAMAQRIYDEIPRNFRDELGDVVIQVIDLADEETAQAVGLDDPWELTGLYSGVSMDRKSVLAQTDQPDMIFLYRLPILEEWCGTGVELEDLVRNVLVHEIAHHFGFSDDDIYTLEAQTDEEA